MPAMFDLTLSFDNGPTPDVTPHVLDVLARRGVKSTFFVIGEKLVQPPNRALAERAHAEGHWIGNHTWSHSLPFGLMEADAAIAEFDRTQQAIGSLMHPPPSLSALWTRRKSRQAPALRPWWSILRARRRPSSCGARCRATGRIPTDGSIVRSVRSPRSPGA